MPPCARRSCRSSPSRRAFFVPFLRWLGRFDTGGVEYATFCPLVPAVLHLAGVHFHPISPPIRSFRRWRRRICLHLPAGRCRSTPSRRAFFIPFLRRLGHFDADGVEYATFCPLVPAVLHLAGVHFHPISPPVRSFRRWRRRICLHLPAGRCRSTPSRRAFFIPFLRRLGHFDADGVEYATFCPLAAAVLRQAGVHFSSRFSAG